MGARFLLLDKRSAILYNLINENPSSPTFPHQGCVVIRREGMNEEASAGEEDVQRGEGKGEGKNTNLSSIEAKDMAGEVYIAGAGMTKFGKSNLSLPELMMEAASKAILEAQVAAIDYIFIGVMNAEEFTGDSNIAAMMADRFGLAGLPSSRIETASSTGSAVFESAFYSIASGYHKNVLVVAGEKMTHLPTARTTKILAEVIDPQERKYGATMPALAAMITQRYQYEAKLSPEKMQAILSKVAIKNHYHGFLNPFAQFRKIIKETDYFDSKWVSYPLRTYDCAPITDGAVAVVLTADKKLVRVSGLGHATDTMAVRHRNSLTSFRSTQLAAQQAYQMAKIEPKDVSLAEIHDAFTTFEIIGLEDLGFFPPKQAWRAVEEGLTTLKGKLPINPSGGLKARGHPVGASGLAQIVEVYWQLKGAVEPGRQVAGARIGLTQNIGGLANNNLVTILERSDFYRAIPVYWRPSFLISPLTENKSAGRQASASAEDEKEGILETFTILYTTPEGVSAPLTLGFVRLKNGKRIIARGQEKDLKIGQKVEVEKVGDFYYWRAASPSLDIKKSLKWLEQKLGSSKNKGKDS